MVRFVYLFSVVLCCAALTGCISLSSTERAKLAELQSKGVIIPRETVKQPLVAGLLNILPGAGNIYLMFGTNESEQGLVAILNLLFWPLSVVWGMPEAAIDATTINKRDTVYYYTFGPGKDEFAPKPAASGAPPTP